MDKQSLIKHIDRFTFFAVRDDVPLEDKWHRLRDRVASGRVVGAEAEAELHKLMAEHIEEMKWHGRYLRMVTALAEDHGGESWKET